MKYYEIDPNELPLERIVPDGGFTSIFRTMGFIGDSLSSGEHESFMNGEIGYNDYYEYSWGQFIGRKCGLEAHNFSGGGLRAKDFDLLIKYQGVLDPKNKCQAYCIALGVNDMGRIDTYSDGFGSMDDVDFNNEDNNKDSYVGHYCRIIQKLRKLEPKCRIFVITTAREKEEETTDQIQKFLLDLPNHFKFVYCIDLRKYGPLYDDKFKDIYYCGGHMNAMGYKLTADIISSYIDYIIRHNYDDFRQVAFIGKENDIHNEKYTW